MKKRRTRGEVEVLVRAGRLRKFAVPRETARGLVLLLSAYQVTGDDSDDRETIPAEEVEVFRELDRKYTRAGACLQGARLKEELSQVELAAKVGISQSDLSKMEHGKRTIGKRMARKLARILNVDYRIFL